jgi:hypothetical protein
MMTKKFEQLNVSWDHALAERHTAMAQAVLAQAFEDYLAQHLAVAGVETLDQLPTDSVVMAGAAWCQELTRVTRNFNAAVKGRPRGGLEDEPDAEGAIQRVKELAKLYRLGEMPPR